MGKTVEKGTEKETRGGVRAGEKHHTHAEGLELGRAVHTGPLPFVCVCCMSGEEVGVLGGLTGMLASELAGCYSGSERDDEMATDNQHSACSQLPSQPGLRYSVLVGRLFLLLFWEADETSWMREGRRYSVELLFSALLESVARHITGQLVNK